jgi:UDP-4-amino-4,6-dideoxy-N-acetyl-beta-L-altrosamine transaminase
MEFIPYSCQNVSDEDVKAVSDVLRSEFLTQGPLTPEFERVFAQRHNTAHAVAVSNATAGLHVALLALGVGAGSRVWTTPNSFVASANCALYCGAAIDFVDIDSSTRNMSVSALKTKLELSSTVDKLPRVVIPVDFAGLPADLREIRELGNAYNFHVLEDASHATGASYLGAPVGSQFAHATVFSFHAVKLITAGEGGMITTNDDALARRLRLLRSHGVTKNFDELENSSEGAWYYEQTSLGYNYRMSEIQSALGISQLRRLNDLWSRRKVLAERYDEMLSDLPVILPRRQDDRESAWHLYVVEIDGSGTNKTRREVFDDLRHANIGANVHYIPIHLQPYYRKLGFKHGDFPLSERYYSRAVSIPLFPALTERQQNRVVDVLTTAFRR